MTAWTDLSTAFAYGTKLTSTQMQQLRDNITAAFEKAASAPVLANDYVVNAMVGANAIGQTEMIDSAIGQGELKKSMGSVVHSGDTNWTIKTLPGGQYGFYPQTKYVAISGASNVQIVNTMSSAYSTYGTYITLQNTSGAGNSYTYAQQRYVTSSGEIHWIFILRTKHDEEYTDGKDIEGNPIIKINPGGSIFSVWQAPDHPCFGNGGKPQLMPHPFPGYSDARFEIIVINPTKEQIFEMREKTIVESEIEPDKDLIQVILEEYCVDETIEPDWPTEAVTVGLPPDWEEKKIGDKIVPIKKKIPRPAGFKTARLIPKALNK